MKRIDQHRTSQRLLVYMPSWVGDVVMATPTLRALRRLYPQAHVTALARSTVGPIIDACPWIDRILTVRVRRKKRATHRGEGTLRLARRLTGEKCDTAVILPNSFRAALTMKLAGINRRVGYERDGRGFLLTDRLIPRRDRGAFVPVPTRDYYLGLARYLGAVDVDPALQLFTHRGDDERADQLLAAHDWPAGDQPLVLITPGAAFGDAKLWYPDRFAVVADRCTTEFGALVAVSGSPAERPIVDRVCQAARHPILDLAQLGVDLTLLKSIVKRCSLVITNDTGPRHLAAAMGVPVVSIFGPTDPAWTQIDFQHERQVMVDVECGPCQLKRCPLDHRCMTLIEPDAVFDRARELLGSGSGTVLNSDVRREHQVNP